MPRARGTKQYQPLSQGLVTEASPLNFPQGATIDELNFVYDKQGAKRIRRKGLASSLSDFTGVGSVFNMAYWEEQETYIVYNTDNVATARFYFFNSSFTLLGNLSTSVSSNVQFTPIGEDMVVTFSTGNHRPIVLEHTGTAIRQSSVAIYVRDFELLDDGISITDRPPTLSEAHQYNLYNAGWYQDRKASGSGDTLEDPIEIFNDEIAVTVNITPADLLGNTISSTDESLLAFETVPNGTSITISGALIEANNGETTKIGFTTNVTDPDNPTYNLQVAKTLQQEDDISVSISTGDGAYPSNADIALLGLTYNAEQDRNFFDPQILVEQTFGNSPAPRGHYVYDIMDFDREERRTNKVLDGAEDDTLTFINELTL